MSKWDIKDCAQSLGYSKTSTYYYRLPNGGECRKLKNDSDFWALVTILPPNRVAIVQEEPKVGEGVDAENLVNMDLENLIDEGVEYEDSKHEDSAYEQSDAEDDNLFGDIVEKCANEGGNVNVSSGAAVPGFKAHMTRMEIEDGRAVGWFDDKPAKALE
ncbi:Hypothetical predicted protein [Prunus dulcis]|uniref:Uncharacterized protein n=1 Tax=Prunus dulcis TaxID=3755 RepID=A0A5E4G4M8_PRUDU|nr:Hypothetical predicted protein [Prunus dulcis]